MMRTRQHVDFREQSAPETAGPAGSGAAAGRETPDSARSESELVAAALSLAGIGMLHRDLALNVLAVNDRYCELVGRSAEELVGLPMEAFTHSADLPHNLLSYRQHAATGVPFQIEKRYVRPDGSVIWCVVNVSFVRDAAGAIASTITIARDVTKWRLAEEELRESEEHYRYSVELNPQISWTAAANGAIEEVNSRWKDVTGGDPADALGDAWVAKLHPDDVAHAIEAWRQALAAATPVDVDYRLWTTNGGYRWFRARGAPRLDGRGGVVRWHGTLEDIHDRRLADRALRDSEERFRLAAEAAGLGIWDYDGADGTREWSDEFKRMLGLPLETVPTLDLALSLVVAEDRPKLETLIRAADVGDEISRFDATVRIRRADDGRERRMRAAGWRVETAAGQIGRVLVTVRDVTEEHDVEQRIRWAATHDTLTGLPNRAAFGEQLERAIDEAHTTGATLALVLFDVDHLKQTNDTIGHDAGDELLRRFSRRLATSLGSACPLARLGGDEFAAVLTGIDGEDAARRIRTALAEMRDPFQHDGRVVDCQATAGVSLFPRDGLDAADLLKAADLALYAAKARSRGSLLVFQPEMRADLKRRSSMINIARDAAQGDRIRPYYQPKVALGSGHIVGFEALLRWRDHRGGIHAPASIAAAFEDLDLAVALSERMLEHIVTDMCRWADEGRDFGRIAFNLSPAEFRHDTMADRILDRLHRAGLSPKLLELEVTETVFLGHGAGHVGRALATLSAAGVEIALDDFGTGYASLTHLQAFPVDTIKIDRSFVSDLAVGRGNAAIIDAVISLGHRLKMNVVAEGVETPEQARYLRARGCDLAQGYLYGQAVAAAAVPIMLSGGISGEG